MLIVMLVNWLLIDVPALSALTSQQLETAPAASAFAQAALKGPQKSRRKLVASFSWSDECSRRADDPRVSLVERIARAPISPKASDEGGRYGKHAAGPRRSHQPDVANAERLRASRSRL